MTTWFKPKKTPKELAKEAKRETRKEVRVSGLAYFEWTDDDDGNVEGINRYNCRMISHYLHSFASLSLSSSTAHTTRPCWRPVPFYYYSTIHTCLQRPIDSVTSFFLFIYLSISRRNEKWNVKCEKSIDKKNKLPWNSNNGPR